MLAQVDRRVNQCSTPYRPVKLVQPLIPVTFRAVPLKSARMPKGRNPGKKRAPAIIVRHEGQTPRERSGCGWRDRLISREDRALAPAAWAHAVDVEGAKPHFHKRATEL